MAASALTVFAVQKLEPFMDPDQARVESVRLAPSLNLGRGTVLGEITPNQTVTLTGGPTGGTFTLTYQGQTTAPIAFNASGATVQAALVALSTIGAGNAVVTGAGPYTVTIYAPTAANPTQQLAALTASGAGLTGGVSPGVTVAWTTAGVTSWGVFRAYASGNTDGSQTAKCLLLYDVQTDASGNVTLSSTAAQVGGEFGQTQLNVGAYYEGTFKTEDLVGLDATALTALGRLIQGNIPSGIIRIG